MANSRYIIGFKRFRDNKKINMELTTHPKIFDSFEEALTKSKNLLKNSSEFEKVIIFKEVTHITADINYTITNPETGESLSSKPISEEPEEEQQPAVQKDLEPLIPNNPYVPNKMVRSTGPMVQLYTIDPKDLFIYNRTTYRLLHSSYPYKSRVFNMETEQEEEISSCVYVIPVTEQT